MESSMSCGQMLKFSLSKLIYETLGTFIFTMFYIANGQGLLLCGLWILTIFCWRISGSHFNPAITFAYIFRRGEGKMPVPLALAYIGF